MNEVTRVRSLSYLKPEHQERVADADHAFKDIEGFAKVASLEDIRANHGNLSIPLYVRGQIVSDEKGEYSTHELREAVRAWEESSIKLQSAMDNLRKRL